MQLQGLPLPPPVPACGGGEEGGNGKRITTHPSYNHTARVLVSQRSRTKPTSAVTGQAMVLGGTLTMSTIQPYYDSCDPMAACPECWSTALVTDWAAGDTICSRCGLVVGERLIDDGMDRQYSNDEALQSRHGGRSSDLRGGIGSTTIAKAPTAVLFCHQLRWASVSCGQPL